VSGSEAGSCSGNGSCPTTASESHRLIDCVDVALILPKGVTTLRGDTAIGPHSHMLNIPDTQNF